MSGVNIRVAATAASEGIVARAAGNAIIACVSRDRIVAGTADDVFNAGRGAERQAGRALKRCA